MIIDKTTGKGCAWSITSKTITKKLLAENILNKLIFRKPRPNRYDLFRVIEFHDGVYVISDRGRELSEEPLWIPSFIDAEIWKQAVSRFRPLKKLDQNIEMYLLPEMGDYLQSLSDAELVSMTRDFLIDLGVIHSPICQRAGNSYYFNENEVYSFDKGSTLFPYMKRIKYNLFPDRYEQCFHIALWRKAVSHFEVGMTLTECIEIFLKTKMTHGAPPGLSPVDQLVLYISPPIFERVPGNNDERTFDHIHMTVGLPNQRFNSWDALQAEVNKYQHEIYQRVLQKLEKDRQFKKYGISINCLKISDVMLLRDFSVEMILELKELKHEVLAESREGL